MFIILGKKFYEQLRTLQKEVELEKRKSQDENNSTSIKQQQQYEILQSELSKANLEIVQLKQENKQLLEQLEAISIQSNQLTTQLQTLQVNIPLFETFKLNSFLIG